MTRSMWLILLVILTEVYCPWSVQATSAPPGFVYAGSKLAEIAFPIGGIGTGSVSLGGRGNLCDWEIFNRPDKGSTLDYTFFAIWARGPGRKPVARILERRLMPPYGGGGHGVSQGQLSGLPRLAEAEFRGAFPFANIKFRDGSLPVKVELEAWNPFIPLNVEGSAIPVAIFSWKITNPTRDTIDVSIAASLANPIGDRYTNVRNEKPGLGQNLNEFREDGTVRGLRYSSRKVQSGDPNFGTMALATTWAVLDVQTRWYRGGWWDQCHVFWDDFSADGRLREVRDTLLSEDNRSDVGTIVLRCRIRPRGTVVLPVVLAWHFPNRENYWNREPEVRGKVLRNYVARKFGDAWDVARYTLENIGRLEADTRAFHEALFGSTLPAEVIDAVSSQMSTLKTNVCMLLEDGSFFGFEGNSDKAGCCPMNCTHVWNYEQTLAYLFPQLERSMRETDFLHNTLPNGYMVFRTLIPLGPYFWKFKACADGQMGAVVRAFREWKLSGDTDWLRRLWPGVRRALEFAWSHAPAPAGYEWTREQVTQPWDPDSNGVMEGEQHNTYDIEFYGPNTMTGTNYLAALKAGSEMARAMGDSVLASRYAAMYESGKLGYESQLWNGEYYVQKVSVMPGLTVPALLVTPAAETTGCVCKPPGGREPAPSGTGVVPKYQYGNGCLSDQLLGQFLATFCGLGDILDPSHIRKALGAIYSNNFKKPLETFPNVQRVYALNDEGGLLLCSWPHGDRPALPFVYSDEVWTGIEYQVAASLLSHGFLQEGLEVVRSVRARYDGARRNPWDEVECGHHYARAMSSWALLLACSGFQYDGVSHEITFGPLLKGKDFRSFWSCGSGWGTVSVVQRGGRTTTKIEVSRGELEVRGFRLDNRGTFLHVQRVSLNGVGVRGTSLSGTNAVRFEAGVNLRAGDGLEMIF